MKSGHECAEKKAQRIMNFFIKSKNDNFFIHKNKI